MAPNELKPHYSSSEEDEEAGEEEEATGSEDEQQSGSESEQPSDSASDQKPKPKPKPDPKKTLNSPSNPKSAIKPQAPDVSSSETGDSDSDTDSDSPPPKSTAAVAAVDPKIKPVSSVPKESKLMKKSGGSKSKSKSTSSPTPVRNKRPAAAPANENDKKKAKGIAAAGDEESKKQLFQRLWSEDDEIVVLKGMIDYKAKSGGGGENTITDMGAFHDFIKKSLHVDVSRGQLVDKIRRLKKKYVNNASRENNGKSRSFSKSHEQKGYELSKLIWGGESSQGKMSVLKNGNNVKGNAATASTSASTGGGGGGLVKLNGLGDREVAVVVEKNMDISRFVQYGGRNDSPVSVEEIVKGGMELAVGEKRVELEERWRSLKKQELEIYLKKMDFVKEQALVVLEAVNASGN